jgi:hypothetical protein
MVARLCTMRTSPHLFVAFVLAGAAACDPGVFSRATQPVTAETTQAPPDSGAPDAGAPAADGGGGSAHASNDAGSAGGEGGAHAAGAGGKGTDREPLAGGGDAGHAGAGGMKAAACPPASLERVTVTTLRDDVLQTTDTLGYVQAGPAVALHDRVLWFVNARAQQDRSMPAFITLDSLQSGSPKLTDSGATMVLLPDEPASAVSSSAPTAAWRLDDADEAVGLFFSRFTYLSAIGAGVARSVTAMPAPAQVVVAPDALFAAAPGADGGTALRPELVTGVLRDGELLYAYDCHAREGVDDETQESGAHFQPCRLMRVPAPQLDDGSKYEFYSDGEWVSDFARASVVIDHVPGALSVVPNAYLKKLLAVHSGAGNDLQLAWADEPQGPFHDLASISTVPGTFGALPLSHAGQEIAVPHAACDPEIVVAYTVPLAPLANDAQDAARPETHVVRLRLH